MSEQHTPGPWVAGEPAWFRGRQNESDGKRPITAGDRGVVANAYGEANTSLIAAAPELLESLKEMREAMAAMMRVVSMHESSIAEEFGQEVRRIGIRAGFGVRAQAAIVRAEGAKE